uniref:Uncharacterized protein n=1 Tax=Strombidium inclinatum TaxID=197538 RepID=A0A7S3MW87_9SPIT|mmetsp:Transcript_21826/g.33789  ORF Transcript_21826/g.33789 Transcript_21826/m.33789 type:complete len:119 (+) Transcript_21826:22-378(+)|eukprot:CAMPEP_0170493136 /NCGR_PEP_ID=MMETSP0208-20121228/13427_1 /TAXON_ID=197538 /ORGANISM="Strombidium inclinatum, Strain S3" /LENGTH=118 /DNA_ID=CAMNT_0010769015 /DNA_START=17 /DNA_END=373 /DNA_ORIENTATION=+
MAEEPVTAGKRKDISVVAEDKNWRSYINNELTCAERWHHDWGFLAGGALEDGKEPEIKSRDQRINELEEKFNTMKARDYVTASQKIGRGDTLEMFPMKHLNIQKSPDLMACPRRPPKK